MENDYAIPHVGYFSLTHHNVDAILLLFFVQEIVLNTF
jgi:hypothetical protein